MLMDIIGGLINEINQLMKDVSFSPISTILKFTAESIQAEINSTFWLFISVSNFPGSTTSSPLCRHHNIKKLPLPI